MKLKMFKFRPVPVVVLALVAGGLVAVSGEPARAIGPVCSVPSVSYATIGSAVADPTCTTINVAAGTYNEQVNINRTLTLNGAQAGVDARTRSGPESIITNSCGPVQIQANNVVINGFTVEGSTLPDPCFIAGIWSNPGFTGTDGGHTIVNNIVQNNVAGIELDSDCTYPTLVQHNLIRNNNNPGPGSGNGIETSFGLCNAKIDGNTFSGDTSSSILDDSFSGTDSAITISNNTLTGGGTEGIVLGDVANSTISGNTSVGSTASATVDLFGGDSNITVNGNVLANGVRGIQVENPFASFGVGPNSGVTAHANCISGNSAAGLEEDSGGYNPVAPGTLDATNNWWGAPSGPTIASNPGGTGDRITDQDGVVSYNPWLTSQPPTPCPVSFTKLASGSFVIGNGNAAVGSAVTFWGAQWSKSNNLSGGSAPDAFKGFADKTTTNPPSCSQNWSTLPGNSSKPPASVPQYMAVIVSSSIGQSGSTVAGNTVHVVVVKTNPGYASNPGHAGTGTVVGVVC
jgi:parallel beta-helix repeat protein